MCDLYEQSEEVGIFMVGKGAVRGERIKSGFFYLDNEKYLKIVISSYY